MKGKKSSGKKRKNPDEQVWINPNSTFKGPKVSRPWDRHDQERSTSARLLELGDIALGLKKSTAATKSGKMAA